MEKNIFINTILKRQLILKPEYINKNLNKNIENLLKHEVGNKCIKEGYVNNDSIQVVKRSAAKIMSINFSGNLVINLEYSANICNPVRGNVIECTITHVNKFGLQAENHPLSVIIAKQHHNNKDVFKNLSVGQKIEVMVIGKRYALNSNVIDIIGKLTTDKDIIKLTKKSNKNSTIIEDNKSDIIKKKDTGKDTDAVEDEDIVEDGEEYESETDMLEDESDAYITENEGETQQSEEEVEEEEEEVEEEVEEEEEEEDDDEEDVDEEE